MRWRSVGILTIACALAWCLAVTPAAAYWTGWMSSARIGFDGFGDPTPESWDMPDVQGNWVVWEKTTDALLGWNVYAYNLKTRVTKPVSTATGFQLHPRVWGDWVVYEDHRGANAEVYAYNLATNTEKRLTNRAGEQESPDISGTKVVYNDDAAGDIYVYDLAKNTDTVLPLGAGSQGAAAISGRRVVYLQSGDVRVYDMTNGIVTPLTNDHENQRPDIDGTLVAWQNIGSGDTNILTQDLSGGSWAMAVSTGYDEYDPHVNGKHVVFVRTTSGPKYNLGIFDQSLHDYDMITSTTTRDVRPSIDGLNVAYIAGWNSVGAWGGDIALGRLIAPSISSKATASVVYYGGKTTVSGYFTENGILMGSMPVFIDRSANNGHTWTQIADLGTNSSGKYSYVTPANYSKKVYRVRYNGSQWAPSSIDHFSALSPAVSVTPRAYVGTPAGYPSTGRKTKSYNVYGTLKAQQTEYAASAHVVVIQCYRKQGGAWVRRKTVNAKVYDYSTYSRYSAGVKLPYSGKWRIRAYFSGSSKNAAKYSAYRYAEVN